MVAAGNQERIKQEVHQIQLINVHSGVELQTISSDVIHPEALFLYLRLSKQHYNVSLIKTMPFSRGYKEVSVHENGTFEVTKEEAPQCIYLGRIIGSRSHVSLSLCHENFVKGILCLNGQIFDLEYSVREQKYYLYHTTRTISEVVGHTLKEMQSPTYPTRGKPMLQSSNECNARPSKFADVLAINDLEYSLKNADPEADNALIFAIVNAYILGGTEANVTYEGIFSTVIQKCQVTIHLAGQLTYRSRNPSEFEFQRGPACGESCVSNAGNTPFEDVCTATSVSGNCLLVALKAFVSNHITEIENLYGDIDNIQLISGSEINLEPGGSAWINGMCHTNGFSSGVVGVRSSISDTAQVVASMLGLNIGMSHDTFEGFVMAESFAPATRFSTTSKLAVTTYFDTVYGVSRPRCMEDFNGADRYEQPLCGNGHIEDVEECDNGFGFFDDCCRSDCTLASTCAQCSEGTCCDDNGRFRSPEVLCRASRSSSCDFPEYCTGISQDCPVDLMIGTGTTCEDTTDLGFTSDGMCYNGDCISQSDSCIDINRNEAYVDGLDVCESVFCRGNSPFEDGIKVDTAVGTPCGDGQQCSPDTCVFSEDLKVYHWYLTTSNCYNCRDEAGNRVFNFLCENGESLSTFVCVNDDPATPSPTAGPSKRNTPGSLRLLGIIIATSSVSFFVVGMSGYFYVRYRQNNNSEFTRGASASSTQRERKRIQPPPPPGPNDVLEGIVLGPHDKERRRRRKERREERKMRREKRKERKKKREKEENKELDEGKAKPPRSKKKKKLQGVVVKAVDADEQFTWEKGPEWALHYTEDGEPYYWNNVTHESQWDAPPGYAEAYPI